MSTKEEILQLAEKLIRSKGYNAFSYKDISTPLHIRNAAVHYYFPQKMDLAVAVILGARKRLDDMMCQHANDTVQNKVKIFLNVYTESNKQDMVCLVGAMAAEYYSFDEIIQKELKSIVKDIAAWLTEILTEGKRNGIFSFAETPDAKALLIITNMIASLQLERISGHKEFTQVRNIILNELGI